MDRPKTRTTAEQEALISESCVILEADERVVAVWLEGSFASGAADPWSDIDLHVAVADEAWDEFVAERLAVLGRIRPLLGYIELTLPGGTRLVSANLSGPVRLDLFIEKCSALGSGLRREQPVVLFDRDSVADSLQANWNAEAVIRIQLAQLLQEFFFGSAWPVRLSGREEWGTLLMNALYVVYQFLVPAMLIQDDVVEFLRPRYHNERHLTPEKRREVNTLVEQIRSAFDGIASSRLNDAPLAKAHAALIAAVWRDLRRACEKHGVTYPADAEEEMRRYYRREMGWKIP